jgi:hypothetical protein
MAGVISPTEVKQSNTHRDTNIIGPALPVLFMCNFMTA